MRDLALNKENNQFIARSLPSVEITRTC